jgi:hypothetical protein
LTRPTHRRRQKNRRSGLNHDELVPQRSRTAGLADRRAEKRGLHVHGFTDQHHFITGILSELLREEVEETVDPKARRALQTLLHPEMLGRAFQVLALEKAVDPAVQLAGFKFARDARAALGI